MGVLFALVSGAVWASWGLWDDARQQFANTVVIVPVTWYVLAGRRRPTRLMRAAFAGMASGAISQLAMHMPYIWPMLWANRNAPALEADLAGGFAVFIYASIGLCSAGAGAILGLSVALSDRLLRHLGGTKRRTDEPAARELTVMGVKSASTQPQADSADG